MDQNLATKKGWFRRNWLWFVPAGCLSLILLFVGFVTVIFFIVMGAVRSSDVYKDALSKAQANPAVIEKLGSPIEPGWYLLGSVNVSGTSGEADLSIPIHGPKGNAMIYATATKSAGVWTYSVLEVSVDGADEHMKLLE